MNRSSFFHFVFQYRLVFTVLAVAIVAASAVRGRQWLNSLDQPESSSSPQGDARRGRVEAEVITILETGFEPSQITRPRGQFLILFDDRTELDDLTLRLTSVAGQRLRELSKNKKDRIVKQLEDLPPGEYLVTEESHPDWACRIKITPE